MTEIENCIIANSEATVRSETPETVPDDHPFGLSLVFCGIGIVVGFLCVLAGWSFLALPL